MDISASLIQMSKYFRLDISHAVYEEVSVCGKNTLPYNRLFMVTAAVEPERAYIANHSIEPVQVIKLIPGQLYFMPKNQQLEFHFAPGVTVVAFHFTMELFPGIDLFDDETLFKEAPVPEYILKNLLELWRQPNTIGNIAIMHSYVYSMLGMFSDKTLKELHKRREVMKQFESLLQHIEEKADAQTTIGQLAEYCNLAQDALSKRFIRASGDSLKNYLTRQLIRKASQMLLTGDYKIKEIAEILNFTSEYYFCRFFKKHTGMRPGEYRESI